jgi:hypothetical protein
LFVQTNFAKIDGNKQMYPKSSPSQKSQAMPMEKSCLRVNWNDHASLRQRAERVAAMNGQNIHCEQTPVGDKCALRTESGLSGGRTRCNCGIGDGSFENYNARLKNDGEMSVIILLQGQLEL